MTSYERWRHEIHATWTPFWHSTIPSLTQHKWTIWAYFVTCSSSALAFSCLSKIVIPNLTYENYSTCTKFMYWIWILDLKIFVLIIFFAQFPNNARIWVPNWIHFFLIRDLLTFWGFRNIGRIFFCYPLKYKTLIIGNYLATASMADRLSAKRRWFTFKSSDIFLDIFT